MARENDNNQSENSNPYDNRKRLNELNELITRKKELIALTEREAQISLQIFNDLRKKRELQGGLTADQQKYLAGATQVLRNNEKQLKQLEALENAAKKYATKEANRAKSLADNQAASAKAAADAQKKAAIQQANMQKAAARQAQKDADKSIHNAEELETLQRSIGKTLGKNSKLYEQGQVFNGEMHTTLTSVSKLLKSAGKNQEKLTNEVQPAIDAYKEFYTGVQRTNAQLAKGEIGIKEHAEAVKGLKEGWVDVMSTLNLTGKAGKKIEAVLTAAGKPIEEAGDAAEKTKKHFEGIESAMDEIGKSGIPLASELSDVVSSIGKGADAARIAFMALGAAAGALLGKIGPGFAQANAYIKAQNDILEEQIELRKELAKLTIEGGFIPEKIALERVENQIQGQMEINKLAREGQFNVSKIVNERLQNEYETANNVNRAMIDAQYAAQRAAVAFNQQMESGAAQFRAAAKTARSGEALGDVKGDLALLQLAGIDADNIANSLSDASEVLGKSPLPEQAKQMSIFAKRTGAAASDVAQLSSVMEVMEGASLETSLNLQEGIKQMAKKTGQSFGNLMKGIAASSKKMLDYGILNSRQLARQVAFAKSIGLSFEAIGDAGRNMVLNYQDSIKGEMTLSALLGKSIDLSEVRQRFYEGDQPGAIEALKRSGITKEDLKYVQEQEAFKQATGGFDPNSFINILERNGKDAGEIQAASMKDGNEKFLRDFKTAQSELSAQDAIISAKTAIIDARLSGKITEAYLKSPGYLLYQNNLNTLAQKQAELTTQIADDWLNSPENRAFQSNLNILSQEQAKLNAAIEKAFLSSKAYQDYLVEKERLGVRRDLTENIIPVVTSIAGTFLFNKLGNAFIGKGAGGGPNVNGGGGGTGAGGFMMMGTQAGAGFGANLSGALKSGGAITGGVVSGLASGFMEFSENKQLGLSMGENIGRTTTKAISSGVGGWGGASLGAAIGTAIFPGVGTIIGGMLGGWLGGKGGSMLGDAVNNGIWGDKQERIKRTQEAQLSAQNELQKQMSLNRQVDIAYYAKMLKLNDQQIAQLEGYNKTQAVQPDWYKQGPAWLNNLKPGQSPNQTYVGSGLAAMPGTFEGDENSPFGRKILKYFDNATKKFSYEIVDVTQTEYEKFIGRKLSKKEVEKAKESAKGPEGKLKVTEGSQLDKAFGASFGKTDAQIFADWMTERQAKIDKERREEETRLYNTPVNQLSVADQAKRKKLEDDFKTRWAAAEADRRDPASPNFDRTTLMSPEQARSYRQMQEHIPDWYKKSQNRPIFPQQPKITYGDDKKTGEVNAIGMDPSKSTLNPENQTKSVQTGVNNVIEPLTNSPSLAVSLSRDSSGLIGILNTTQSQAHTRGILMLNAVKEGWDNLKTSQKILITDALKGFSDTITPLITGLRDSIVGSINRLLVFTKASSTAISTDTQNAIDNAAKQGLKGSIGLSFPGYAKGTPNHPGGVSLVGEKGPELMYVPQSAAIVPNGDTNRVKRGDVSILSKWGIPGYADGKKSEQHQDDYFRLSDGEKVALSNGDPKVAKKFYHYITSPAFERTGIHAIEGIVLPNYENLSKGALSVLTYSKPSTEAGYDRKTIDYLIGYFQTLTHLADSVPGSGFASSFEKLKGFLGITNPGSLTAQQVQHLLDHGHANIFQKISNFSKETKALSGTNSLRAGLLKRVVSGYGKAAQFTRNVGSTTAGLKTAAGWNKAGQKIASGLRSGKSLVGAGLATAGKGYAKAGLPVVIAQGIYSAFDAIRMADNPDLGRDENGNPDWIQFGNNISNIFAGNAWDVLNGFTLGLADPILGQSTGLTIAGLDGRQTALLRQLYKNKVDKGEQISVENWIRTGNPMLNALYTLGEYQSGGTDRIMQWVEMHQDDLYTNIGKKNPYDVSNAFQEIMETLYAKTGVPDPYWYDKWYEYKSSVIGPYLYKGSETNIPQLESDYFPEDVIKTADEKFGSPTDFYNKIIWAAGRNIDGVYDFPFRNEIFDAAYQHVINIHGKKPLTPHVTPETNSMNSFKFGDYSNLKDNRIDMLDSNQKWADFYNGLYWKYFINRYDSYMEPELKKYKKFTFAGWKNYEKQVTGAKGVFNGLYNWGKNVASAPAELGSAAVDVVSSFFASGVDSAPGGNAVVGEKGMEMMLHNGMASMIGVDGPEIRYIPKGAEILPNHKLPAMAEGTIGATAAMMASNTQQLMQIGQIIADAITSKQDAAPAQNINLLVDGRQLANVQYRRQQNRLGMRPNDLV